MNNEIILDTKLIGDIKGNFFVPSYQRGYRWGKSEVTRLLEDLCSKTRDEWLNCEIDSSTARYFYSTAKRVLSILDNDKM